MKPLYFDSSLLLAVFAPWHQHGLKLARALEAGDCPLAWNPALRQEVRHNLRKETNAARRATAWQAMRASEQHAGRLHPTPWRWERLLQAADKLSERLSRPGGAGTWDFLHVAAALEEELEFWTADKAQGEAARDAGLKVKLFA